MPLRSRNGVLGLLILLAIIMYLDRICISIAGPRMQEAFGISPKQWGLVLGAFTLSYALFEIPSGRWGDRFGARLHYVDSAGHGLLASRHHALPLWRRGSGRAAEHGHCDRRWFPTTGRAQATGNVCMAMQAGAVIAPFLVVPLQQKWGWQASFFVFGAVGIVWAAVWYALYRDELGPEEHTPAPHSLSLAHFTEPNILACMCAGFCYVFGLSWFIFWMPTFLVKGRGFTENQLLWTSIPPIAGALGNIAGGWAGDQAARAWGLVRGRRSMGMLGLSVACAAMLGASLLADPAITIGLFSLCHFGIAFQQTLLATAVMDMSGPNVGAIMGAVNMAATAGGLVCSVSFGYFIEAFGSYDLALLPMAAIIGGGAFAWLYWNPCETIEKSR